MSTKPRKEALLTAVAQGVSKAGFREELRKQSFSRATVSGRQIFHLSFIDHRRDFDIVADMSIRFDAVEAIIHAYDSEAQKLSKGEKKDTSTLGVEIGSWSQGQQKRWSVSSDLDVAKVADELLVAFDRYVLPFFEEYSNMERAFASMSKLDKSAWLICPVPCARAERVLAMAKLLDKGTELPGLRDEQDRHLQTLPDASLPRFREFAGKLLTSER